MRSKKIQFRDILLMVFVVLFFVGCQQDEPCFSGTNIDETIFLREQGCDMPIRIMGNADSKVLILFVHGGPGEGAWFQYKNMSSILENYAVAFWDQRSSGSTQSTSSTPLTVDLFVSDMTKVLQLLESKFSSDVRIYIFSHSWGGTMSTLYFSRQQYSTQIKGWINMDGACDPILISSLEREALIKVGNEEISAGRNQDKWNEWITFCNEHDTITNIDDFLTLNGYAGEAQSILPDVNSYSVGGVSLWLTGPNSIMSYMINNKALYKNQQSFLEEVFLKTDLADTLSSIDIPTLILWGRHDLVIPIKMAELVASSISSSVCDTVVFENSAHVPLASEPDAVNAAVIEFIEQTK